MFIKFRNLDDNGDWEFGKGNQSYADELQSTMLNIKTRLKSFKWDCYFDLDAGIDWFEILAKRGQYVKELIEINVRLCILQSLYVTRINKIDIRYDEVERKLFLDYNINTIFGEGSDSIELGGYNV